MRSEESGIPLKVRLWNRVPVRLGAGVLMVTWAALALVFMLFNSKQEQLFTEQHARAAKSTSMMIAADLAQNMMAGGGWDVWNAISAEAVRYRDLTGEANIMVFTGAGIVKAASDSSAIGTRIEMQNNPDCPRCDSNRPEDFPALVTLTGPDGAKWLRVVNSVPFSHGCIQCHQAGNSASSYVSIDYDLTPLARHAAQRRNDLLIAAAVAGVLVMALTALLFRVLVMRAVHAITRSAHGLAAGRLKSRADVVGNNELALLARDFNQMAVRIEEQVARIEAAHTESELLYTLVVEASKNLETSDVAFGVAHVLGEKLKPRQLAFFLETGDAGWTCASGGSSREEKVTNGEGALEDALRSDSEPLRSLLIGMPLQLMADACRLQKLEVMRSADSFSFVLPVIASTRLAGLLICVGIPERIRTGEGMLQNLGVHLTLAAINSRNYTGAITDGLTRLKNKRYGLARLEEALYAAQRYKKDLGLAMCDIDHFKRVNDTYGHPAGDAVLKEVSRRLAACVRKADIAVRYGGEEFMLILPESETPALAGIGEKLRQAVAVKPVDLGAGGVSLPLSISVGIAAFRGEGDSAEALIARADAALYRAKNGGRDRVEFEA